MRSELADTRNRSAEQGGARRGVERVGVRARRSGGRSAPVVYGGRSVMPASNARLRARRPRRRASDAAMRRESCDGWPNRDLVAVAQRAAVESAECAAQIRRAAAEHLAERRCRRRTRRRHGIPPPGRPNRSVVPAGASVRRHGRAAPSRSSRPRGRRHRSRSALGASKSSAGPMQRRLECRGAFVVSDEQIRQPQRHGVHRAADRHALVAACAAGRGPARSSAVRRVTTRASRAGQFRNSVSRDGAEAHAIAGGRSAGSARAMSKIRSGVLPIRFHPPGESSGYTPVWLPADADRAGRNGGARRRAPRCRELRRAARRGTRNRA